MKKNERNPIFANLFLKLLPLAFAFGLILLAASTSPAWAYSGDYALEFDGETDWVEVDYDFEYHRQQLANHQNDQCLGSPN